MESIVFEDTACQANSSQLLEDHTQNRITKMYDCVDDGLFFSLCCTGLKDDHLCICFYKLTPGLHLLVQAALPCSVLSHRQYGLIEDLLTDVLFINIMFWFWTTEKQNIMLNFSLRVFSGAGNSSGGKKYTKKNVISVL